LRTTTNVDALGDDADGYPLKDTTCKIFIVDDDESVRNSLLRLLKSAGFKAAVFKSAEHFLRDVPSDACGCVVIDVHMPGMSGFELQKLLVKQKRKLSVIIMTAYEDAKARESALDAGATAFLKKPFDDSLLIDAVSRALGTAGGSSKP
jgi:FixJ family two-component response regulator